VGVVGQIIPWNFPLLMAAWKLGAALCCGCTVILKPAEQTPLTALRLGELFVEAGFPNGVVNIVTGAGETGAALANHPDIDKVAFTGSTEIGHEIIKASAGTIKRVTLELGGKSPNIVFKDADLEIAPPAPSTRSSSTTASAAARAAASTSRTRSTELHRARLGHGQGHQARPGHGAGHADGSARLRRAEAPRRGLHRRGQRRRAPSRASGREIPGGANANGYFVRPTLFENVDPNMSIVREEIFGPVVVRAAFDDIDTIAREANDSEYGLAAGIWTRTSARPTGSRASSAPAPCGSTATNVFDAASPFGGFKQSGYGREMGHHALKNYTETKSIWVRCRRGAAATGPRSSSRSCSCRCGVPSLVIRPNPTTSSRLCLSLH
jgi:acyl-CoA reductase-like NAD-dependent aldehyde dehydrogenase